MTQKKVDTYKVQMENRVFDRCARCDAIVWQGTFEEIQADPVKNKSERVTAAVNHYHYHRRKK